MHAVFGSKAGSSYVCQRADGSPIRVQSCGREGELLNAARVAAATTNRLLVPLPRRDRERFLAVCETVELEPDQVLMQAGGRVTHAWFPVDAIVSLGIAAPQERKLLEVALVGWEGMVGLPMLLLDGAASGLRATVVRAGAALRIAAEPLQSQLRESPPLAQLLQRYLLVAIEQMAQAALCTRYHRVDQRLVRWLLMTQDRTKAGAALHATHEFLAATLGVRRAGVTRAAAQPQDQRLIAYRRGVLTLLDPAGLQAVACACYAADLRSYAALMELAPPA
jgi:CRP-like cAMP-binding protein